MNKFENRLNKLEERLQKKWRVPREHQGPYITWGEPKDGADPFADIKARLMDSFESLEGAKFYKICWQDPDADPVVNQ